MTTTAFTEAAPADSEQRLPLAYMPRLDGLRGLAIAGVLMEHFCPSSFLRGLSPGGAGVTLFFVLSGYLITRILLGYKQRQVGIGAAALQFYWRRFLRLAPPLYLTIFIFGMVGKAMKGNALWHGLYLTNFLIGLSGKWGTGADQFWSLATEEQFYLLWFFVVMLLTRRALLRAILISFAITFCFRSFVFFSDLPPLANVLLPGNLVSLTSGALLAYASTGSVKAGLPIVQSSAALWTFGALFALLSLSLTTVAWPNALFYPFVASGFFACIVYRSSRADDQRFMQWLSWAPLRHIGKISYGIYVYHLFIPGPLFAHLKLTIQQESWGGFVISSLASILAAEVSWVVMESPILRLKEKWFGDPWLRHQSPSL